MDARKSLLNLLSTRKLKSNKLEDVQEYFDWIIAEINKQWRLLWQDVNTIQVDPDGFIYFGGKDVDGSWRVGRVGNNWEFQRRESGTYTKKGAAIA